VRRRWFILGVSLPFVAVWVMGTAAGVALGPVIPDTWQIGFIVPLMFIAVMVPSLRTWPALTAALVAVAVVLIAKDLPYGLNVLTGALTGIAIGSFVPDSEEPGIIPEAAEEES
jgi:predicted branched-subunit amino acid permease